MVMGGGGVCGGDIIVVPPQIQKRGNVWTAHPYFY